MPLRDIEPLTEHTLTDLGWSDHFAQQAAAHSPDLIPARIAEVHRDRLRALGPHGPVGLVPAEPSGAYAVGDWVLTEADRALHRLTPLSDLARKAAGHAVARQRIAANIDTLAIVTSCNADFNIARLERYLALAASAGCLPLVVLTKADLCDDPDDYRRRAERLSPLVTAITLDAKSLEDAERLTPWCGPGQTLALVGSSGVGKTTLRNALTEDHGLTQGIRSDDAKGRHTTTFRSLIATRAGGWLIDTPGMRELQLLGADEGIDAVFDDIDALVAQCRFSNCGHESEPGCAVQAALQDGSLDPHRLARWDKLKREELINSETVAQGRRRGKAFAKMVKNAKSVKSVRRSR